MSPSDQMKLGLFLAAAQCEFIPQGCCVVDLTDVEIHALRNDQEMPQSSEGTRKPVRFEFNHRPAHSLDSACL